jgi:hypothetical protein
MIRNTLVLFFILSVKVIFADTITNIIQFHWQGQKKIVFPAKDSTQPACHIQALNFKGATYPAASGFLPHYETTFPIPANYVLTDIKLKDKATITIQDISEIELLLGTDLKDNFETKYSYLAERGNKYLHVSIIPIKKIKTEENSYEKLLQTTLHIELKKKENTKSITKENTPAANSVLHQGTWVKINIPETGIYKLSYSRLEDLGVAEPKKARVYGFGGGMLPLMNNEYNFNDLPEKQVHYLEDGIIFYAKGPHDIEYDTGYRMLLHKEHPFSNHTSYFISSDASTGKQDNSIRKTTTNILTATKQFNTFLDCRYHETRDTNLVQSGRTWYGEEYFDSKTTYNFSFDFPDLISDSTVSVLTSLIARSTDESSFTISSGNNTTNIDIRSVSLRYDGSQAKEGKKKLEFKNTELTEQIPVDITYNKGNSTSVGWLDYIVVNAYRKLKYPGKQLLFSHYNASESTYTGEFIIENGNPNLIVWDVTDPHKVYEVTTVLSGNNLTVTTELHPGLTKFAVFDKKGSFYKPETDNDTYQVANQNLHGASTPDMAIVVRPGLQKYAVELADFHKKNDGLESLIVLQQEVFNEFSSGIQDPTAIRNFMRMFYTRALTGEDKMIRYLLLFGDGTYDYTLDSKESDNYIVTFQSSHSLSPTGSYVTDDYFGLLDTIEGGSEYGGTISNSLLDIGIGRLPVKNEEDARIVLDKIYMYVDSQSMGYWRNELTFIADDADDNQPDHMQDANKLTRQIEEKYPVFHIEKIYLDAFPQKTTPAGQRYPDVNQAIHNRIKKGTLILNYTGHGHETGFAHENILDIADVRQFRNEYKLPVFMTATCELSRFDDHTQVTAGEEILLNPEGGGIALFTTTRLVYIDANYKLNRSFYNHVFEKDEAGKRLRFGDIMRLTKNGTGSGNNKLNFTLLGDPALMLTYAKNNIVTTKINSTPIEENTDTLKAFSEVSMEGMVTYPDGSPMKDFKGTVYPVIYDKKSTVKTLSNDGFEPLEYTTQNNILYKGRADVKDGIFKFSFVVPGDISYNIDSGRVIYYADNDVVDAAGSFEGFLVGGSNEITEIDNTGPSISLYMNDESFINGNMTDQNPVLLAVISDESGINTSGTSIGHDITAVIDDNTNNIIILNDYYISDFNSYTSGRVEFPLLNLEPGKHTIKVKVWDIFNNSSESTIEFIVKESDDFIISNLYNYPNPVRETTEFYFEHNQSMTDMDIEYRIFNISGKHVASIKKNLYAQGYRIGPVKWNCTGNQGSVVDKGIYIYRLKVSTAEGKVNHKQGKFVIMR